jgi:signal transduction histidine kinase
MEANQLVGCADFTHKSDLRGYIYLEPIQKTNCTVGFLNLSGVRSSHRFKLAGGEAWDVNFTARTTPLFHIMLWLFRAISVLAAGIISARLYWRQNPSATSIWALASWELSSWTQLLRPLKNVFFEPTALPNHQLKGLSQMLLQSETDLKESRSLANLATRVAHDIRSPLMALTLLSDKICAAAPKEGSLIVQASKIIAKTSELLLAEAKKVSENSTLRLQLISKSLSTRDNMASDDMKQSQRYAFDTALARAPDLTEPPAELTKATLKNRRQYTGPTFDTNSLQTKILDLVALKKIEFSQRPGLRISAYWDIPAEADEPKIDGDPELLLAMISNLVNNSAESIEEQGFISISVGQDLESIRIDVRDSGHGFSAELLAIGPQLGISTKLQGQGIGLASAQKTVESWNGRLKLHSPPESKNTNRGATVSLFLNIQTRDPKTALASI